MEDTVRGRQGWLAAPTLFLPVLGGLRRRGRVVLACAAALAAMIHSPNAGAQQQAKLPTIGFLGATTPTTWSAYVTAFLQRMRELDWIDGRNMVIEYRWAQGRADRYAEFAAEFVARKVDVIVTSGTGPALAVKKATAEIPIVFATAGDPVGTGLVKSLARPGGNVTGLSNQQTDLAGRRFELLREIVPGFRRLGIMGNIGVPNAVLELKEVEAAAAMFGLEVVVLQVKKAEDIAPGIESLRGRVDALYICTDPLLTTHRVRINTIAVSEKLPTMYPFREYVQSGGLMSYGPNLPDLFRRAAEHVDKILRGAKPANIPVEQPIKYDLIVNLTTGKALGLKISEAFLLRANEVIE
jgi:putative ABC transport system substrate-binding protein